MAQTNDHRLPLHARTQDDLMRRIKSGEWQHDQALPSEGELARQYDISVGTMRRVLSELVARGVIERRQGRGTFVRRAEFTHSLARFFRAGDTLPVSRILAREHATPPPLAQELFGADVDCLRLLRLRLLDNEPYLVEDIWLPLPLFAVIETVDTEDLGDLLYPAYERLAGQVVATASEDLTVVRATLEQAVLLDCPENDPVVRVDRVARSLAGDPLEYRVSHGAAHRFHYHLEIS